MTVVSNASWDSDSDDSDSPREACGVIGVSLPGQLVAPLISDGLHALQHRGQESAGLAVRHGSTVTVIKDMGLVTDVLNHRTIGCLEGDLGIGHTRYSTTGRSVWQNAQPIFRSVRDVDFALGHNGNLTNTLDLRHVGSRNGASNDSDVIAELLVAELAAQPADPDFEQALLQVLPRLEGAFSLVLMDQTAMVGVRDPNGFRPLCLGRLGAGWVLASETAALDTVGARFVREVMPGEMVVIRAGQPPKSSYPFAPGRIDPRLCVFEFVYLARPDSILLGREVHGARVRMGSTLASKHPVDADMVIGVPESGVPAAEGYARTSGIPFGHGLVKNRYIGRTFIDPSQATRERLVRRKLNVLREQVAGKRLVVVEDSVVRGTTTRYLARMLREAGAAQVHLRVVLPQVTWPCFYGIDIGSRKELIAATHTVEQIRERLEVDSLAYLSVEDLRSAIDVPAAGFCDACLTGNYPIPVPLDLSKDALEKAGSGTTP